MKNNMKFATSISKNFWAVTFLAIISISGISLIFSYLVYKSYLDKKIESLPDEASKIDYIFTDSIQYIENYGQFIGHRIALHGADDLPFIASLIGEPANAKPNPENLFITTLFDWVNPQKQMVVSSDRGVFKQSIDMSYREYLNQTPKNPWTLQLQDPAVGVPSGQWIIPGGIGITDANGKYLGALTLGLAIDGLAKKINSALMGGNIEFIILTKDFSYVGGNLGGNKEDDKYFFVRNLKGKGNIFSENSGTIRQPIVFNSNIFSYYQKSSKYGFIVLTGYNKRLPVEIFNQILLPRLLEFSVIGTIILFLLFILRRNIMDPLVELSSAVDSITKGQQVKKLPRSSVLEIRNLTRQIINVMRYMNREKRHKQQIYAARIEAEKAVAIAREAKFAKEEFSRKLRNELKSPLNIIIDNAEKIIDETYGHINPKYIKSAEEIYKSGYQIGTLMTNVLNLKKVDAKKILKECISVHKDRLYFNKIRYVENIENNIPEICVDEVRFKQIIIGILYQALLFTPENASINVKACVKRISQMPKSLVIIISDTGYGFDEEFRNETIFKKMPKGIDRNSDGTDLTIDEIRSLLSLHKGTLEITSIINQGTIFTINIPFAADNEPAVDHNDFSNYKNVTPLFGKKKK